MPSFLTTHEEPQEESLLDMDERAAQPSSSRAADKSKATLYAFRDTETIEAEEMPKPRDIKNDRATIRWMEHKLASQDKLLAELKRALERHRIAININSEATQTNIQRMCDAEDHVADVVENLHLVADFLTEFKSTIFNVCDGKVSTAEARRQSAVLDVRMAMSSMFDKSKDQSPNLPPKSLDGGRPSVYNPRARSTDDSDQQPPRQRVRQRQGKKAPRRSSGPIRNKSPSPPPPDPSSSSSSAPPSRSPSRHRPSRHGSHRCSRRRSQRSHNSANPPPSPGFQLPGGYQLAVLDPELWLRHVRDGTVDSQPSAGGDKFRIKKDDIGQFNPHGADPDNEGVVGSGKDTIYIDVDCFLDRLETFREDPLTSVSVDKQLAQIFVTLLAGPASYWWTDQLTGTRRRELRALGISAMLEALRDRFPPDPAICTAKFTNLKLRLKDIAADDTALEKHMTTKLRLAKGMGILESSNSNWFGTVMTIWSTWPKEVRQYIAVPDNYPLPLQSDIINSLRGKQYITAVDATSFFYQFGVYPPHRDRFTLISPRGLERSTVALMGFRNSPAYTQRFMDQLLTPHAKYCRAFIDDIVIYSDNLEDHKKHLRKIFKLFISKNIAISPSKSFVGYPNVELLGFRVDGFGLSNTADRIAAYKQLDFPRNLKALEQYIGSTGFLRHLIPYYAQLVEPLQKRKVALLAEGRKDGRLAIGNPNKRAAFCRNTSFTPTAAETESFNALQENICSEPTILIHFNPDRQLFLQVDGSLERGFGVMLFHVKHGYTWKEGDTIPANQVQPIMFLSKCLTSAETRYGPSELEVACLAWAVKRLHTIIHSANKTVIVLTDHSATKGIVEKTKMETTSTDRANKRLINASVYLSQFNLKVHHLAGKLNFVPDALSRLRAKTDTPQRPDGVPSLDDVWFAFAEAQMDNDSKAEFIQGYATDKRYSHIIEEIKRRPTTEDGGVLSRVGYPFVIVDDLLYNVGADGSRTLCVPYAMVKTVLEMVHDEKHHFGRERMLYDLRGLSIHGKTRAVKKYLQHCHSCNSCSNNNTLPHGDYQPIRPSDTLPMRTIGMDFIVGLPAVPAAGTAWQIQNHSHYNALLTVTDKATKRSLLIPGDDKYTAEEWGHTLMRHLLLSDWGVPHAIISDRDAKFTSSFWKGMWKALGTKLLMTAAYHPQGDGMAERKNQTVELAIRYHLFNHPGSDWVTILPHLQWSLNTAYSEPIGSSPHELLFGVKLPGPLDAVTNTADATAAEIPVLRDYLRRDAALAMDFAAAEAKRRYDAQHKAVEFQVGDQVFLKLHSGYHLPGRPTKKLSQQRSGPWIIKRKIGRLAYELDFLPSMGIHPVVSVAHLSAAPKGEDPFKRTAPPPGPVEDDQSSADEPGDTYEVEVVTAHKKMANGSLKYLIKWKGWDNHNNEWKTEWQLRNSPELIDEYWARKGDHDPDAVANRQRILPRTKPAKAALRKPATKKDGRAGEAVRGTRRSERLATD